MSRFIFDHIHLRTPDPEDAATFYENMFGAEIVRSTVEGKPRIDIMLGGGRNFVAPVDPGSAVGETPQTPYQGLDHFGLTVSGIDTVAKELKAKGAEFTMEPTTTRHGTRIAFIRGPQGVSVELVERTAA